MRQIFVLAAAIALASLPSAAQAHLLLPENCVLFMAIGQYGDRCLEDLRAAKVAAHRVQELGWSHGPPEIDSVNVNQGAVMRVTPEDNAEVVFTLPEAREINVYQTVISPDGVTWHWSGTFPGKVGWVRSR